MKRLIAIIALLVLPYTVGNAASFEDIVDQVRVAIRDTGPSDSYRYTQLDIVRAINFIHSEICNEARIPESVYSTTTVAGQAEYDLPTDISGHPLRVSYYISSSTSNFEKLSYIDIGALDSDNSVWESRTAGLPKEYYLRADKVGLYPAPSATYSTTTWNTLKIDSSSLDGERSFSSIIWEAFCSHKTDAFCF